MANINKIRLSGQTYNIEDVNASKTVELTQAQYDALVDKDPNTYYIITDAQAGDLTNYYTKSETSGATQISTALTSKADTATTYNMVEVNWLLANKQATLVSGTNIKTINNESILGSGNIDIQGGGVDVVQTTGTSTTDVMSQNAVTTEISNKANKSAAVGGYRFGTTNNVNYLQYRNVNNDDKDNSIYYPKINGKGILTSNSIFAQNNYNFQLVETSAITTSVSSSSTDAQIPSAKAVYDAIQEGGGGGGTVDQTIISGSTNAVAGGAVYDKIDEVEQVTAAALNNINDRLSEDEEVTAAGLNAVNDKFDGLKLKKLTQQQYDALTVKDPNTLYVII